MIQYQKQQYRIVKQQVKILELGLRPEGFEYRIQSRSRMYHKAFKLLLKAGLLKKDINCYRTTTAGKSKLPITHKEFV